MNNVNKVNCFIKRCCYKSLNKTLMYKTLKMLQLDSYATLLIDYMSSMKMKYSMTWL